MTTNAETQPEQPAVAPATADAAAGGVWEPDLLTLFVRNQIRVSLAMPILSIFMMAAVYSWTNWVAATSWFGSYLTAQAIQYYLCHLYEQARRDNSQSREWIGMLCASETLIAVCWVIPLFAYWEIGNQSQHIYLVSITLAAIAARVLTAGNYMPIILAGTGIIALATMTRCLLETGLVYNTLASIVVLAEIFFVQLVRRLQGTAQEMLVFKAEREALIGQLDGALCEAETARTKAEEANLAKSRFLATMSHELRTPLNAILGFSEILSKEMMGPHAVPVYKSYSDDIHYSGDYLLKLINDILDLSRIEANRSDLDIEPVDPCALAKESAELLSIQTSHKAQEVEFDFPDQPVRLLGDNRAMRQIWLNLLSNAVKFAPDESHICIGVRQKTNGSVILSVSDNGPGLHADELDVMRTAFVRGAYARTKAIDGAGLGLSIVNGLAELHEARLALKSNHPTGLIVSIEFPSHKVLGTVRATLADANQSMPQTQRRLIELTSC
ncbi:sensor histidine kinase [Anderseniella sp. Alg231-50]|uniref:sensor histidine kinase n=1 Tax=Anderseniella sp. Alg231-50 TaxID=1922226 RepID=UPI00307B616A